MTEAQPTSPIPESVPATPAPSVLQRAIAVFVRPTRAWSGLEEHAQWWFPTILMALFNAGLTAVLFPRAIVPMQMHALESKVADGSISAEQMALQERIIASPTGIAIGVVAQSLILLIFVFLAAAIVMFAVNFILGVKFRYRLALEVTTWSWLVQIPLYLATGAMVWANESLVGAHVGFGALLPVSDSPSRLQYGLGNALDAFGPLALWPVVVAILGIAALSGAPRKATAWAIGSLYVVLTLVMAVIAAVNAPVS